MGCGASKYDSGMPPARRRNHIQHRNQAMHHHHHHHAGNAAMNPALNPAIFAGVYSSQQVLLSMLTRRRCSGWRRGSSRLRRRRRRRRWRWWRMLEIGRYHLHHSGAVDTLVQDIAGRNISHSNYLQSSNGYHTPVAERCKQHCRV